MSETNLAQQTPEPTTAPCPRAPMSSETAQFGWMFTPPDGEGERAYCERALAALPAEGSGVAREAYLSRIRECAEWERDQAALAACRVTDPDGPTVKIKGAYRAVNSKMSGDQTYRRVRYPGSQTWEWPDCERLPALDFRANSRNAAVFAEVPIGTLVADYESALYKGAKSKAKVRFAIVIPGKDSADRLYWLDSKRLRSRPVYVITLPDGETCECEARE